MNILKLEKRDDGYYATFQDERRLTDEELDKAKQQYESLRLKRDGLMDEIAPLEEQLDEVDGELEVFGIVFEQEPEVEEVVEDIADESQ